MSHVAGAFLVRTVRDAGAEVVEDVGLTGDFSHAVATCAEQLQRQWENKPPQIVHTVGLVATMAALAARRDGLPVVSTFDESPVPSEVEARLARQVDAVIPLSTPEQDVWRQLGAHTASPGVIALAQPAVDAPARTGEDVVCLCSGDELSRVVDSMPYWGNNRLVILGRVSDDRWAQLIQQARALGVEQRLVRRPGLRGEQRQAMWRDAALLLAGTEGARHGGFVLEPPHTGFRRLRSRSRPIWITSCPGRPVFWSNPARALHAGRNRVRVARRRLAAARNGSLLVGACARSQRAARCWPAAVGDLPSVRRFGAGADEGRPSAHPGRQCPRAQVHAAGTPTGPPLRGSGSAPRRPDPGCVPWPGACRPRFNPELGNEFHSFAVPTILGELRRSATMRGLLGFREACKRRR